MGVLSRRNVQNNSFVIMHLIRWQILHTRIMKIHTCKEEGTDTHSFIRVLACMHTLTLVCIKRVCVQKEKDRYLFGAHPLFVDYCAIDWINVE